MKVLKIVIIILVAAAVALAAVLVGGCNNESTIQFASLKLKNDLTMKLTEAMYDELGGIDIGNMIAVSDENGIMLLRVDPAVINTVTLRLIRKAGEALSDRDFCCLKLPLGSLTGLAILSGRGPEIEIKTIPLGAASGNVESEMISAGINQTNHRIYLTVHATVSLLYPFNECSSDISCRILLCETVIAGRVPQVIWGKSAG